MKKKGFVAEFKEFIMRGNVMDMAVGVIIATAFGKITTSLVNDICMPLIGMLVGGIDLSKMNIVLKAATDTTEAVTVGIGTFLTTIIDFILVALVVFLVVRGMNRLQNLRKKDEQEAPAAPEPTKEELLLTEIRDLLKDKE